MDDSVKIIFYGSAVAFGGNNPVKAPGTGEVIYR